MDTDRLVDADGPLGDDELMAWLRLVANEVDPVPENVIQAAWAAMATRDLDGELAVLLADSHAGHGAVFEPIRSHASVRDRPRLLTFAGGGVQIDMELDPRGDAMDVIGQLTGAGPGECAIQHAATGWHRLDVDDLGRFIFSGLTHGPVRLRCQSARARAVITTWVAV